MTILLIGLVLFFGIHLVRVVAPDFRTSFIQQRGEGAWKGIYSLLSIVGLALMIWGYATYQDPANLYAPLAGARGISLIAIPISLWLIFAANFPPGHIKRAVKHPMLWGILLWALVHLAINGDAASVLLFGTFAVWALITLVSSFRRPKALLHGEKAGAATVVWPDVVSLVMALVLTSLLVSFLHEWLIGVAIS